MLFSMAWRNLWRRPVRTWLSVGSMAFTSILLVFMLSMQLGVYDTMKANMLRVFDGFAQIQPTGYRDDPDVATAIADPQPLLAAVRSIDGVTAATPRATAFAILANGEISYGAAIVGVDPATEPGVSTIANTLSAGRYLNNVDEPSIILGDILARNLGLELGDAVTVLGSGADRSIAADSLELVGMFHSGLPQMDRQIAQMPLARFQDSFALADGANVIAIAGENLQDVNRSIVEISDVATAHGLTALNWAELQPALQQAIALDASTSLTVYVSLIAIVVFILLNTLLMSVLERTREFGMMLAIGMQPGAIGRMMWMELILLSAIGSVIGIVIGGLVTWYFQIFGIPFPGMEAMMAEFGLSDRVYPTLSVISALAPPLAIIISVAIGGVFPYRRILKLEPVSAMDGT